MKQKAKGKTKLIDEATVTAAKQKASETEMKNALASVPKTKIGFEKDITALRKDPQNLLAYLKQIPITSLEGYFKHAEVSVELLSGLLGVLTLEAEQVWVGNFLTSLAKA